MKEYITDWLASKPVFYNEKTAKAGYNINDVIDFRNLEIHPEGLNNYLDFGYSVFGLTPIKNVKFLRHSSKLTIDHKKDIRIEYLDDPIEKLLDTVSYPQETLDLLQEKINAWENSVKGTIIIPTSGGYDSRLLNFFIKDKSRIKAFTYGISEFQSNSYEVKFAGKLAEILKFDWQEISLNEYNRYIHEWLDIFGASVHAHGMYHIEFYKKILEFVNPDSNFLSGIIGDMWAGNHPYKELKEPKDVLKLGLTHNLNSNSKYSLLKTEYELREDYWLKNKEKLQNEIFQAVTIIRFKIILISYLLRLPENFGFNVYGPYIDISVALSMLTLGKKERTNRKWQADFFKKNKIDLENMKIKSSNNNTLDLQSILREVPPKLDVNILKEYIKTEYIELINRILENSGKTLSLKKYKHLGLSIPKFGGLLKRIGVKDTYNLESVENVAYSSYLTLKPIEYILKKRDAS